MKTLALLLAFCASLAATAFAREGGMDGGGGSYVLIDGKLMIADPYYAGTPLKDVHQIKPVTFEQLPPELQGFTKQVLDYLERQRVGVHYLTDETFALGKLEEQIVQGKYYLVPKEREQNVPCDRYLPMLDRPVEEHFQFGCTFEDQTFIFIDKFNLAPVDQQAFALMHERLWAVKPDADQKQIAEFMANTMFFYNRFAAQILANDRIPLTSGEIARLREFYFLAQNLFGETGPVPDAKQFTAGGGVLPRGAHAKLDGSFLGLGTYVDGANISLRSSVVVGSWLQDMKNVKDSRIVRSRVQGYQLDHVELEQALLYPGSKEALQSWSQLAAFMDQNQLQPIKTPTLAHGMIRDSWVKSQAAISASAAKPFLIESSNLSTLLGIWAGEGLKLTGVELTGSWKFAHNGSRQNSTGAFDRLSAINFQRGVSLENIKVINWPT